MSLATLSGSPVTRVSIQLPKWGVWWADVELADPVELTGAVSLVLADATYSGTIKSGGVVFGKARYRIAGGAGAWATKIPAQSYANDAGVKRTSLATDAAAACGETVDVSGLSGTVGGAFARAQAPASDVLARIAPRAWYVGEDGTTRFGARAATAVTTDAPRVRVEPDVGLIVLASPTIASLVPGATVDGLEAVDVRHELGPDGLRTTLWGSEQSGSRRASLRALVRSLLPELLWGGTYEYRIVLQSGERLTLQPVLSSLGLPDLTRVRVRPGVPGMSATHNLGSLVLVGFANCDPARPVVVAFDDADSPGFLPDDLELDANDSVTVGASATTTKLGPGPVRLGVARLNDLVVCGGFGGTVTSASTAVESG